VATNGKDFPNSGALFRNDRKRGDRDPEYAGSADVTCPRCTARSQFFLNSWVKAARTGAKFFSLSFKPKNSQPPAATDGDDIPF
jgi:hypothetical protein